MNHTRVRLSPFLKEHIIKKAAEKGVSLTELASQYNISPKTIQGWKTRAQKQEQLKNHSFVQCHELPKENLDLETLKKVELEFKDYTMILKGEIKPNVIQKILSSEQSICST